MDDDHRPDVRLHAPCAGVVVVRVAGSVEEGAARGLHDTLHSQLPRATHVILDLADVRALGPCTATTLAEFGRTAAAVGCRLHLTDVPDDRVRGELVAAGMAPASCPEAVVALLPSTTGRSAHRRPRPASWGARTGEPTGPGCDDRDVSIGVVPRVDRGHCSPVWPSANR